MDGVKATEAQLFGQPSGFSMSPLVISITSS